MLGGETPFDLQMHVLRIPVRVIPTFWLVSALMGWDPDRLDLVFLWIICVFVSILFHELGHALTAEAFGYHPHIVLNHFGGYAQYYPGYGHTPFRSLMITLGGPLPQMCLGMVILALYLTFGQALHSQLDDRGSEYLAQIVSNLAWINIAWALMNLLPVLPLDGGQALNAILEWIGIRDARGWAVKTGILVGGLTTALMYQLHEQTTALLFLMLTIGNLQELQSRRW